MSSANTQNPKSFEAILAELAKPFDPAVVEFKPGAVAKSSNRALALAYVDARAYETRLDEADPAWSNAYLREYPEGRVVVPCPLTVGGITRHAIGECLVATANGAEENAALSRTTRLCVAAHQDDIEFMAYNGIADCFAKQEEWFAGVVVTDGAGSPRCGR